MAELSLAERIAAEIAGKDSKSNATVSISSGSSLKASSKSGDCPSASFKK